MQLETRALGVLVSSYCCSTYRVAESFSSLGTSSSSSIGGPVFHPIADCEHPLLCLPGPGIASQETAISGSFPFLNGADIRVSCVAASLLSLPRMHSGSHQSLFSPTLVNFCILVSRYPRVCYSGYIFFTSYISRHTKGVV